MSSLFNYGMGHTLFSKTGSVFAVHLLVALVCEESEGVNRPMFWVTTVEVPFGIFKMSPYYSTLDEVMDYYDGIEE